jgi:very-short-patch-repair endonuclease
VDGIGVTTPLRTAFDLARRTPLVDAVVAVDALPHAFGFTPQEVLTMARRQPGARGSTRVGEVARLANPLAESPMESRIRYAIHEDGLPVPVLQHPVGRCRLDLAHPGIRLGSSTTDGSTSPRSGRDLGRQARPTTAGRAVLRFRAHDVTCRPWRVAATGRGRLIEAPRTRGLPRHEFDPR